MIFGDGGDAGAGGGLLQVDCGGVGLTDSASQQNHDLNSQGIERQEKYMSGPS